MPTDETITAREAGLFLPGMRVKCRRRGYATVLLPTESAMASQTFDGDDMVYVRWDGDGRGTEAWARCVDLSYA